MCLPVSPTLCLAAKISPFDNLCKASPPMTINFPGLDSTSIHSPLCGTEISSENVPTSI